MIRIVEIMMVKMIVIIVIIWNTIQSKTSAPSLPPSLPTHSFLDLHQ